MSKKREFKILLASVMTAVTLLQYSCVEEGPKTYENAMVSLTPMNLSLSTKSLSFNTYGSSTQTIMVTATDIAWEFTDIPDWITIIPSTGKGSGNVKVTCKLNEGVTDRIGIFTFRSRNIDWNYSTTMTVSQVRNVYKAIPEMNTVTFPWTASQAVININANSDSWSVSVPEEYKSWCSTTKTETSVIINCTENTSKSSRKGHIVIETPDNNQTVNIEQSPIQLDLKSDTTALYFSSLSGVSSISIETCSGVEWTTSVSDDWITVSPSSGKGNGMINVSVSENETDNVRSGYVYVNTRDDVSSMAVIQSGKYLTVSSKDLIFGSTGGEMQVSLKTNDGWNSTTENNWIELSPSSGTTDCNLLLKIGDNNSAFARKGQIKIIPAHSTPVIMDVEQNGRFLTLSDTAVIFFYGDSVYTVSVNTDGTFAVNDNCSWIDTKTEENRVTLIVTDTDGTKTLSDSISVTLTNLDEGEVSKKINIYLRGLADSYVDMGLSVKWATCNVGALKAEDYGDYFAWGETAPYYLKTGVWANNSGEMVWKEDKANGYAWSSYYDTYDGGQFFELHNNNRNPVLFDEEDVATVLWGDRWRMPTREEMEELLNSDNCSWTQSSINGVNGYLITSKKSGYENNSIFLPYNGYLSGQSAGGKGYGAYYWTKTLFTGISKSAFFLNGYENDPHLSDFLRYMGVGVRAVRIFDGHDVSSISLNHNELDLMVGYREELIVTGIKNDANKTEVRMFPEWSSSDSTVATVVDGKVYAKGQGTCIIKGLLSPHSVTCTVTVTDPYDSEKEHEWVDLGLSIKWATVNLGAVTPEGFGDYFAWGETEPYYELGEAYSDNPVWKKGKEKGYDLSSYSSTLYDRSNYSMKYNWEKGKSTLEPEDDAAHVRWGENWRIPNIDEFKELYENCNWSYTTKGGVSGYSITSKMSGYENRSIFLPIAGNRYGHYYYDSGEYWINSLSDGNPNPSAAILASYGNPVKFGLESCSDGLTIRAVSPFTIDELKSLELDRNEVRLMLGNQLKLDTYYIKYDDKPYTAFIDTLKWSSSDSTVATVVNGNITAIGYGTCDITVTMKTLEAVCKVTVVDPYNTEYEGVDLGLSVKWATFNVGAVTPEMIGDYFAWGETSTYYEWGTIQSSDPVWLDGKKNGYTWVSYFDALGNYGAKFNKYFYDGGKKALDDTDDVATVRWGGDWRMPTNSELLELCNECNWELTQLDGVEGFRVSGKKEGTKNNSIFLPIGGFCSLKEVRMYDGYGYYWSKTLCEWPYDDNAYYLHFSVIDSESSVSQNPRHIGMMVRPVCPYYGSGLKEIELNYNRFKLIPGSDLELLLSGIKPDNSLAAVGRDSVRWQTDNSAVATVSDGIVTAVGIGSCTITATLGSLSATCSITVQDPASNPPEMVDLGMSVKWATYNVGACSPDMLGDYYAWGETSTYYEDGKAMMHTPVWKNGKSSGYHRLSYAGNTEYDVATAVWGVDWRIPTFSEFNELKEHATWKWTINNGVKGYLVTSNIDGYKDRSIFLPAAGHYTDALVEVGEKGSYWSKSIYSDPDKAYCLSFSAPSPINNFYISNNDRFLGYSIRPVSPFRKSDINEVIISDTVIRLLPVETKQLFGSAYKKDGNPIMSPKFRWTTTDDKVAVVSDDGLVTAVGVGDCKIMLDFDSFYAECRVEVVDITKVVPEYVDLGLSVKWATFNVGSFSPEIIGDYFAWGETEPLYEPGYASATTEIWKAGKTDGYSWSSYSYCRGSNTTLTKYCMDGGYGYNGFSDFKTTLDLEDDVAHVKWGGDWRMPTKKEISELISKSNCTWTWATINKVAGYIVTSKKSGYEDRSIFIPLTGYRLSISIYANNDSFGGYWSSTLNYSDQSSSDATVLRLSGNSQNVDYESRYEGLCVRPVHP